MTHRPIKKTVFAVNLQNVYIFYKSSTHQLLLCKKVYAARTEQDQPRSLQMPPRSHNTFHFLPVAASLTLSFPEAMALTVSKISEKLSKVVKATFSRSQ